LADLTIAPPADPPFELPPPEECEETAGGIVLAVGHELRIRFVLWNDRHMVEFAIMQIVRRGGKWHQVTRIDTCHSAVHRHWLKESDPDNTVGRIEDLEVIPASEGWLVVDRWYDIALKKMQTEWEETCRRWELD
jgi:hypothetical protein